MKSLLRLVPNVPGSGGKGGRYSESCGKGCHSPMYVSIVAEQIKTRKSPMYVSTVAAQIKTRIHY